MKTKTTFLRLMAALYLMLSVAKMEAPLIRAVVSPSVKSGVVLKGSSGKAAWCKKGRKCSVSSIARHKRGTALAKAHILYDLSSQKVVYSGNDQVRMLPASLTKMMTLYAVAKEVEAGRVKLSDMISFSKEAVRQIPINLGVTVKDKMTLKDALVAVMVRSANDVAYAVGENVFGDRLEAVFNKHAKDLNMKDTYFKNSTGLYAKNGGQYSTARDLLKLAIAIRRFFPEYLALSNKKGFYFKGRYIQGTNKLTGNVPGVVGMKTGHLSKCGWHLATYSVINGKEFMGIFMGYSTGRVRNADVAGQIRRYNRVLLNGHAIQTNRSTSSDYSIRSQKAAQTNIQPTTQILNKKSSLQDVNVIHKSFKREMSLQDVSAGKVKVKMGTKKMKQYQTSHKKRKMMKAKKIRTGLKKSLAMSRLPRHEGFIASVLR